MVVFTNAYLASLLATATPLTHARIGYQTWLRDLDADDVVASSAAEGAPADAILRPGHDEFWEPTALPATLVFDLGTGRDVDYAGIAGHTLGSSGCAVMVETSDGSFTGSPSEQVWVVIGSGTAPGNDDPLVFLGGSRVCRYVRMTITGGSVMPRICVLYAGVALAMPRPIYGGHTPMNLARNTELYRGLSKGGQFLAQSFRSNGTTGSASWKHLEPDWYRTYFDPFVQAARSYPFFFAWRPASYPREAGYAWCPEDIKPSNMGVRQLMQVGFSMQGEGHE